VTAALELVIGLVLVYFLLSLLVSAINEAAEGILKRRGKYLLAAIERLLGPSLKARLFEHGLIESLSGNAGRAKSPNQRPPSYIPARTFTDALIGTLVSGERIDSAEKIVENLRDRVQALDNPKLREVLEQFLAEVTATGRNAVDVLGEFREKIEQWFNDAMDRVSGWYKRNTRWFLLFWGIAVVFALNADSLLIAKTLWNDETVRASVVAQAEKVTAEDSEPEPCPTPTDEAESSDSNSSPTPTDEAESSDSNSFECVANRVNEVEALSIPLGWPSWPWDWSKVENDPRIPNGLGETLLKISGLILTAAALTLGADFWFNLLNKVVNLRATGRPPQRNADPS
jgi:hypothetical protein